MKIIMAVELIHWECRGNNLPDGMRPNAQLGTRMPNGLFVSLLSVISGDFCSSDFESLKVVLRPPTTKDSDTADLDSISVAPS